MTAHILALTHGFSASARFLLIAVSTYGGLIRIARPGGLLLWPLPGIGIMLLCVLIFWFLFAWLPGEGPPSWDPADSGGFGALPIIRYTMARRSPHGGGIPPPSIGAAQSSRASLRRPPAAGITLAVSRSTRATNQALQAHRRDGTGKSTAIREILTAALARESRHHRHPDGGYLAASTMPARRCDFESLMGTPTNGTFREITNDYDVEQLARSLIPDGGGSDSTEPVCADFFSAWCSRPSWRRLATTPSSIAVTSASTKS